MVSFGTHPIPNMRQRDSGPEGSQYSVFQRQNISLMNSSYKEPFIVAEIGVNHEGSLDAAIKLVESAASAGADAVKFQTYTPERYASSSDAVRLARVKQFALDEGEFRHIAEVATRMGIEFFSTPVTEDVVPFLDQISQRFKIASGDLTFEPVIRAVCRTGKPVLLSTGLGTVDEIDQAVKWITEEVGDDGLKERLTLMQCVSAYPTPIEEANILSVSFLAQRYNVPVGYSNHVLGPEACLAAVAHGASIIEVHFTDSKHDRDFRDHELSFDKDDLSNFVKMARRVYASLGTFGKTRQKCEEPLLQAVRKGLVAARDLSKGVVITDDDLMFARPATEFSASEIDSVIGRKLLVNLRYGELIPVAGLE